MLNNYVDKTISSYVDKYFEEYKINPEIFEEYNTEQKEHLIDLSKNIDIIQEKAANCIYERFLRLSTQGKTYIETVINIENAVNKVISNMDNSVKNSIRQIGYSMLLYDYEKKGFNKYHLVSNDDACGECKERSSHTYRVDELLGIEFSPFVHPNCRCSIEVSNDYTNQKIIIDENMAEERLYRADATKYIKFLLDKNTKSLSSVDDIIGQKQIMGPFNKKDEDKPVITIDTEFGTGLYFEAGLLGLELEIGGKRYYNFSKDTDTTENLEFSVMGQLTDEMQIGVNLIGTIDATTREHIKNGAFIGAKVGDAILGWDSLDENEDIFISFELGAYLGVGGALKLNINLSEWLRQRNK